MTPSLRKTHRLIWMILPILFPLLFWAAITGKPKTFIQDPLYETIAEALPQVIQSKDTEAFLLNWRGNDAGQQQIEVVLKTPLLHPAPIVYLIDKNRNSELALGHLGTKGIYRFPLPTLAEGRKKLHIEILDSVKKERLLKAEW